MLENTNFHHYLDTFENKDHSRQKVHVIIQERKLSYQIYQHFHPYTAELIRRLIQTSISGLQASDTEYQKKQDGSYETLPDGKPKPVLYEEIFSESRYKPSELVTKPYPVKDLDFSISGAYSVYNWELFYHVPLTIAIHLSKNQHFEEAQQWFHFIFDPTDDGEGPTPERFWKVKPFQTTDVQLVEDILLNLSSHKDPKLLQDTVNSIGAWRNAPFRPHVVARYRQSSYMFKAVMAYLDNLIAWGDMLFRQDTGESINEGAQIYILAASLLGPRPQAIPKKGSVRPMTYANLQKDLDEFGNVLSKLESDIPFNLIQPPPSTAEKEEITNLNSVGLGLYFCIPRNDKLMEYWDTVADRLFKIRNSLNFQGIFRQLPLFEPPIDPALLAKAAAAGLDVAAVISGTVQSLPLVRFQFLIQRASEICQEVKALGSNLLSAMEKEDNEALAILRAQHEHSILKMAENVKYQQWQESIKNREVLEQTLSNFVQRFMYYERLLGETKNEILSKIPKLEKLNKNGLEEMKFKSVEPILLPRDIPVDIAEDLSGEGGGKKLNQQEATELLKLKLSRDSQEEIASLEKLSSVLGIIPDFTPDIKPIGLGAGIIFGGSFLSKALSLLASSMRSDVDRLNYEAANMAKIGSYSRREQEWAYQSTQVAGEINQIYKQIRAAQIREQMAEREYQNHQKQIKLAEDIEKFLSDEKEGKITKKSFYTWMKREIKGLYGQCFQFTFDIAKKAERALQHELGDPKLSYIQYGYLTGKEGLLAGEKLYLDIKRMEMAYHDLNTREYELTKNVSLWQVDPIELLKLRKTGNCTVSLPEELFDLDGPGHYFRRIKSISLSIPSVTSPYSSVNCTLTLQKSTIRTKPILLGNGDGYAREGAEDSRFNDFYGSLQSIVTSTGMNDSGMFETNLHDERYLPFEGSGVISNWQLQLPSEIPQFDFDTINDVILHIRYTAREGGGLLRNGSVKNLNKHIDEASTVGSVRFFSVRHEFPNAWTKFQNVNVSENAWGELKLIFREEHYPYWSREKLGSIKQIEVFAHSAEENIKISRSPNGSGENVVTLTTYVKDLLQGKLEKEQFPCKPADAENPENSTLKMYFNKKSMKDVMIAVTWGK